LCYRYVLFLQYVSRQCEGPFGLSSAVEGVTRNGRLQVSVESPNVAVECC